MMKYLFSLLLFVAPLCSEEMYHLSICAIFRNEARFLKEWIEYHRMIGVEHFYLFNHLSDDAYEEVLDPYVEEGVVELFQFTEEITNWEQWIKEIQCSVYNQILKERAEETKWLAVIDTDEFIVLTEGNDLPTFLKPFEPYAALGVVWQLYGTSGVEEIPEGQTMLGTLIYRAPRRFSQNRSFKSIVQPKRVTSFINPHFAPPKAPYLTVLENHMPVKSNPPPFITTRQIRLNHYIYRDEAFYWGEKSARWLRKYPDRAIGPPDGNLSLIEDRKTDRFLPELEERLFN